VASEDSMAIDVDTVASDFEELDSDEPAPKKTATKKKAAPPKKPPAKGRGKKAAVLVSFMCCFISQLPCPIGAHRYRPTQTRMMLWKSMKMNLRKRKGQIGLQS
jgi:hypothetical protein